MKWRLWIAAGVFLAALSVRGLLAAWTGFDGLYGQDPYAYYDYAVRLHNALRTFQPPPPFFWPLGYPLPVALTLVVVGLRPLAGQVVSLVGGAVAAAFVSLLISDQARPGVGALAGGLLVAVSAQATISSLSVMSDALGLAWATLSAWAMLHYCRSLRPRWLALAAFALGGAVLTRWIFGLAALPWAFAALFAWRRAAFGRRHAAGAILLAVLIGGLVVGSQFVFGLGRGEWTHVGDLQVVGWDPANALRSNVENSDGVFRYERPIGLYYALPPLHPAFVFPLFTPFLLLGLWVLRRPPWSPLALLLGWPLTIYAFLAGIAWQNPRFSLALFPPLAALAGLGVEVAWQAARASRRVAIALTCILALAGSLAWMARDVRDFVARKDADLRAARWAEAQLPPGATVVSFGLTETLRHYTSLQVIELYNETPEGLNALACDGEDVFLYVDAANIEAQWAGKSPEVNLRWLRERVGLRELGRSLGWTLYAATGNACSAASPRLEHL